MKITVHDHSTGKTHHIIAPSRTRDCGCAGACGCGSTRDALSQSDIDRMGRQAVTEVLTANPNNQSASLLIAAIDRRVDQFDVSASDRKLIHKAAEKALERVYGSTRDAFQHVYKRVGPYTIFEGSGPDGGRWLVSGRGERKVYDNPRDAVAHAEASWEG
jgi:hypothetical protein